MAQNDRDTINAIALRKLLDGSNWNHLIWENYSYLRKIPQEEWCDFIISKAARTALQEAREEVEDAVQD